ncbi:hypothetical protein CLV78_1267 [Aliiruegeria haliotis]|uniref:Resolvase-like protein n=1 Tax=Aliiruegeria haliotis TaxID=1280846 RepID=A0A2T0RDJ1_9RHOB|nr:hypothetical protein [Aliiruegeria haliotis]PRY19235.1 hypothetical protein CLV78_1267 [Aliiruegeria haliotis]
MDKAVGFYWTLPVKWAGFTSISPNADEAAGQSETVRFQVELVRRYARDHALELVHEEVFLEIDPDRGSEAIFEPLRKLERLCQEQDAVLLIVDFTVVQRWREHSSLNEWSRRTGISIERVSAEKVLSAGRTFDPHTHFSE